MFAHNINPVLFSAGIFEIRYYGIIFVAGFVITYFMLRYLARERGLNLTNNDMADLLFYLVMGVIIGARLFYVVFYNLSYYWSHMAEILAVWKGGLSFHGGLIGAAVAVLLFCKEKKLNPYDILDIAVIPASLGLALGRIGNFLNGELYGRLTSVPWAVDFGDGLPRHPSQIYESLKNLFIFSVLFTIRNKKFPRGFMFWAFVTMYGALRFFIEFFRLPDEQLGFIILGLSMGQLLCIAMVITGSVFLWRLKK